MAPEGRRGLPRGSSSAESARRGPRVGTVGCGSHGPPSAAPLPAPARRRSAAVGGTKCISSRSCGPTSSTDSARRLPAEGLWVTEALDERLLVVLAGCSNGFCRRTPSSPAGDVPGQAGQPDCPADSARRCWPRPPLPGVASLGQGASSAGGPCDGQAGQVVSSAESARRWPRARPLPGGLEPGAQGESSTKGIRP